MRNLRLKHIKQTVQGPTASEEYNQDLNSGSLIPKLVVLNMMSSTTSSLIVPK